MKALKPSSLTAKSKPLWPIRALLRKSANTLFNLTSHHRGVYMSQKFKKSLGLILPLLLLSQINSVYATQVIDGADKQHQTVNISAKEQNRLAIGGNRRIQNVVPSRKGVIVYEQDKDLGVFYFALANDAVTNETMTLFVTDEKGVSYKLILVPKSIPGEELILTPPTEKVSREPFSAQAQGGDGRAVSYQRQIKEMLLAMANKEFARNYEIQDTDVQIPLWKEGQLTMIAKYTGNQTVGEKYRLTNIIQGELVLAEQELYRPGVRAVAVGTHTLSAGESALIYIVRDRKENE